MHSQQQCLSILDVPHPRQNLILPSLYLFFFFNFSPSNTNVMVSHCGFVFSPWWLMMFSIFSWAYLPSVYCLWWNMYWNLLPVYFYWIIWGFRVLSYYWEVESYCYWSWEFFINSGYKSIVTYFENIFCQSLLCLFISLMSGSF